MFQILGECQDIAENVALALSIITLFVLCEPRDQVTIHSMEGGYTSSKYRDIMGECHLIVLSLPVSLCLSVSLSVSLCGSSTSEEKEGASQCFRTAQARTFLDQGELLV